MTSQKHVVIGTRGSELALIQTEIIASGLKALDPSLAIDVRVIATQGDTNQNPIPLDTIGKGWFTQEIESALLAGTIDLAVHSLKDMANDMPAGLLIGAYLSREDARDVLITKNGQTLEMLRSGAIIGTDSARRQTQMRALRSDVVMQSVRGNVPKRLQKLQSENYDALILAAAGLKRLGLEERIARYFEVSEMTPAPGQGTLAVQYAEKHSYLGEMLKAMNDPDVEHVSRIERSFSMVVGGGCKSPTGAYAVRNGSECVLFAMIEGKDGTIFRDTARAAWTASAHLGEDLARKLLMAREHAQQT